jgi:2-polyprenyl-3-methyl-5-hydroxy-6-metoxy-1,4-benzoquinol methylase
MKGVKNMNEILLKILDAPAGNNYKQQIQSYNQHMYDDVIRFPDLIKLVAETGEDTEYLKRYNVYMRWAIRKLEYSFVLDNLPQKPGLKILDVGAGVSIFPHILSKQGYRVDALDPDKGWLLAKTEVASKYNLFFNTNVNHINNDVHPLNTKEKYDVVISVSVLEHLPIRSTLKRTLKKIVSLIKPGGSLIMTIDYSPRIKSFSNNYIADRIIRKVMRSVGLYTQRDSGFSYNSFVKFIYPYLPGSGNLQHLLDQDRTASSYSKFWSSHSFDGCLYTDHRHYLSLGISLSTQANSGE